MTADLTCPICGNTTFRHLHECIDHSVSHETFSIKVCTKCQLGITLPQPSEKEIEKYYASDDYVSHTGKHRGLLGIVYTVVRKISLTNKYKLINRYHQQGDILDYGCGTGEFLSTMKKKGWKITGVEPSPIARKKAIELNGESIYPALKEIPPKNYDIITLWHVLEHVHELNTTLESLTKILKPNGVILLALPNFHAADAEHYQSYWAGFDVPRHLWHFSKTSISQLLNNHNLSIASIEPMKFDAFYISLLSERYRGSQVLLQFLMPLDTD